MVARERQTRRSSVLLGTTLDMDPSLPMPKQGTFPLRMPVSAYGL